MPTYEYRCAGCGREFEVFQSMKDKPLTTCEECGGALKRLIGTGAGIIFKGTGYYCTDFRGKNTPLPPAGAGKKGKKPAGDAADKAPAAAPKNESAATTK